ncbi:MAG: hypothetical protein RJA99_1679 [Pseudomonadota bacterium]|jgi:hypothetical protein
MSAPAMTLDRADCYAVKAELDACIALICDAGIPIGASSRVAARGDLQAQLEDCRRLIESIGARPVDPIRTLHHLACTGGTLFAKCLSALPNVRLLSEVDPLSDILFDLDRPAFAPSDLVALVKLTPGGRDPELIGRMFRAQVEVLHSETVRSGRHLLLRDHSHSHFCVGDRVPVRPRLVDLLPSGVPVRSVITVRHPVDSFTSLQQNGWVQFTPPDFGTYCARQHAFIDAHPGIPVVRYEDFVADPLVVMRRIVEILEFTQSDDFVDLFGQFRVTGDSGRSSDSIGLRERHPPAVALARAFRGVHVYETLLERLGYSPEDAE